jgi:uncharacterized protein (DUF305 family)
MGITWRWLILSTGITSMSLGALVVQGQQHGSSMHMGDKTAAGLAWSGLNSSMEKMHAAMTSVRPTGDADVDFVRLMLPHHQAAIDMAKTQLLFGKDPQTRRLAQEIITDQQLEIELMQGWLKQH